MDWGTALGGMDDELKNILVRNKMMQDNQLTPLKTLADVQNQQADNARADQSAADLTAYRKLEIQNSAAAEKRLEDAASAKQKDQDEVDALSKAWADMPDGPDKVRAGQLLSARIKGFKAGGSVLSVVTNKDGTQSLANIGAKGPNDQVVQPKASEGQTYVPDPKTLTDAADAMRAGDPTLWNALIARGAAGNVTREALATAYASGRPDDYEGFAAAHAGLHADTATLTALQKAVTTQAALHDATTKNFEVMRNTMSKIPDLGTDLYNKPIRLIDSKLFPNGNADIAAYNMARLSALREYERLVSSNLEAKGQITDSARSAYDTLMNEDTPLPTAIAQMTIMNQDMDNLQDSIKNQKTVVDREIANRGKKAAAVPVVAATTPTAGGAAVANEPSSVGTPVVKGFEKLPPLVAAKPGSKGAASAAAVAGLATKFGVDPSVAKAYLIASGYAVQ